MKLIPIARQRLCQIAAAVHANAMEKGFHPQNKSEDTFVKETCNNLHDEVSELHTAWREGNLHNACDKAEKMRALNLPVLSCAEEELADIIIRALDTAERLGLDMEYAIAVKHTFNTTRPRKHGGKKS